MEKRKLELVVKGFDSTIEENNSDVILISGYANKFLDDNGKIVVDHSYESVIPESYDFKSFMKNPILLYQHRNDSPIGKVINIDVRPNGLYIEAEIHKRMNEQAFYGVQNGILKTLSIGFIAKDGEVINDILFFKDVELLEVSVVSIPDNSESTFAVLTESPCKTGTCLLANKAITKELLMEKAIKNSTISERAWSDVDKTALGQKLAELGNASYIREAYLVVRDIEKRSTWKFPHHELTSGGDLVVNKGGVVSAYAALKGARNEPAISAEEKKEAARHILKHYRELLKQEKIEEIPQDLLDMVKEFEELVEKGVETPEELEKIENEQNKKEETINNPENDTGNADEGDSQNPEGETTSGEGGTSNADGGDDGKEVAESLLELVDKLKETEEGLDELFLAYSKIEEVLNEALSNSNEG